MYHVVGTIVTVSILYLLSLIFYRTGFYTQALHRRLWNSVLALTFLFTALAGIFMAFQIRFKWDTVLTDAILKWHVETGVVLGMTGIFHFLWHFSYFGRIFKYQEYVTVSGEVTSGGSFTVAANLFLVGFTTTSVQVLLIREMMNITGGYELISGVFLASWLILSAAGAALAVRSSLSDIPKINLFLAAGPFISISLLVLFVKLFLTAGEVPSFLTGLIMTLIILAPYCLISGFAFVKLLNAAKERNSMIPGKSYAIETLGGINAGLLITFLTSGLFNTYELLLTITLLYMAYVVINFFIHKKLYSLAAKALFTLIIAAIITADPDVLFRQVFMPAIKVRETRDTPYGNITKGVYAGEQSIYYDQRLLEYSKDAMEREEDIHYALLQVKKPESVLLISGSAQSRIPEILKYNVGRIVYVERDPGLAAESVSGISKSPSDITVETKDALRYMKKSSETFDAIIMLLPPPSTLSLNRFYTTEFFSDARSGMKTGGVLACSPGPNDYYFNQESLDLYSSIYNSLRAVFRHVVPVLGNKLYFLASDEELSVAFCRLAAEKKIENIYVSPSFLSDDLIQKKTAEFEALMNPETKQNTVTRPVACFHFQSYNFSKSLNEKLGAILLMLAAFVIPVVSVKRKNKLMYFSAAALAGFEIIILLTIQLTAGNMYQLTGLVLAALMSGLAAGAGIRLKWLVNTGLRTMTFTLVIYYLLLALMFNLLLKINPVFIQVVIILLVVIVPSYLTGHIFTEITVNNAGKDPAGATYSADLAGSALGFVLVSWIAVPAIGIRYSIILMAGLIFTGILFGTKSNK